MLNSAAAEADRQMLAVQTVRMRNGATGEDWHAGLAKGGLGSSFGAQLWLLRVRGGSGR